MRILGHMYHLGWGWGGGVVTMVLTLEELRRRGHSVGLMLQRGGLHHKTFGARRIGIADVYSGPLPVAKRRRYREADIIITQGEATPEAMKMARLCGKPLAHLIHDEIQLTAYGSHADNVQLAIYNSEWTRQADLDRGRSDRSVVLNPLVFPEDYVVDPGTAITLVNLCIEKGGETFWEVAARMPEHQFLAVKGGWGGQIVRALPNVEVLDHQLDPRDIYQRSRIILMPSQDLGAPGGKYWTESWGRVGIEAAASGIPTIAHPTPGLVESLGEAGIFADRYDVEAWCKAIRWLDDLEHYAEASAKAKQRSAALDPVSQLDALEAVLIEIADEWRGRALDYEMPLSRGAARPRRDTEGGPIMKVRAVRSFLSDAGMIRPGMVIDASEGRVKAWQRRGLVEIIEQTVQTQVIVPDETQVLPPPKEVKSGISVSYRSDQLPGQSFASREDLGAALRAADKRPPEPDRRGLAG